LKKIVVISASCLAAASFSGGLVAQTGGYPAKPVRLISPFPPGGSVDLVARLIAPKLSESLGQQVVVDNRSGASGTIGTELAARAAPDGYTLLVNTIPLVTNMYMFSRVPYDVLSDFAPISLLSSAQNVVTVHPSVPVYSVRELLQLAKSKPGALNYASAGPGTNPHIAGELFNYLGKVNLVVIHFKGGGPGLVATMSGEVSVSFSNIAETSAFVKSSRLRALGVTSLKRSPALPDVPTISEAGIPGYEFVTWHAMVAPKGTPGAIVAMLNERVVKVMRSPDTVKRFGDIGLDVVASSPEELAVHLKKEAAKWGKVIKERGMKAE
jgi:tripartite-type tricarboxylate transporter receptor subunit TctC